MPDSPTSEPESDFVCDCRKSARSACAGEPFYKEYEAQRYCVLHFPGKEKRADFEATLEKKLKNKDFNFRDVWFPADQSFFKFVFDEADFSDATFSAKANFSYATFNAKANFSYATFSGEAKFEDATFSAAAGFGGATFRAEAVFEDATFSGVADFYRATFKGWADFRGATFRAEADFGSATFSAMAHFFSATFSAQAGFRSAVFTAQAGFSSATFSAKAYFFSATFGSAAFFSRATFADANFTFAIFSALASFNEAIFANYVEFAGNQDRQPFGKTSSLDFQFATIEKPDRVSFHTLTLYPHWFINIDPRKFDFSNVDWNNSGKAKTELELLIAKEASPDKIPILSAESSRPTDSDKTRKDQIKRLHRLLAIACQRLAANCEDNSRYRTASHFRRMALDAERLETWRGFDLRRLNWWYWLASGYGERPFQALLVLVGILVLFGLLYTQVGFAQWEPRLASEADALVAKKDDVGAPLKFSRALTYSAGVLTFQRPEPKPATWPAQAAVLFETILGPVQAALLALAIRRKFMR